MSMSMVWYDARLVDMNMNMNWIELDWIGLSWVELDKVLKA